MAGFDGVPAVEIGHRPASLREECPVLTGDRRAEFEAKKTQPVLRDKRLDCGKAESAFLHMKQQITTFAGTEKIGEAGEAGERRLQDLLPAATDIGRR